MIQLFVKQDNQIITKLLLFGNEKLKAVQNQSILTATIKFLEAIERFKTSLFNSVPNGMVPLTQCHFSGYSKLAGKVSKKHVLNLCQFTSTV